MSADLASSFLAQAKWCEKLGSPFTHRLLIGAADVLEKGGWVNEAMGGREWREADAAPLRFAGALHAAALQQRDAALVEAYAALDSERALFAAREFFARDPGYFTSFLAHAPQTNETRRAIAFLPAFLKLGAAGAPLHMIELGASAGLNLHWDRFFYRTQGWAWGEPSSAPAIDTDWTGPPPGYLGPLNVASRAGCDLNPLDIDDADDRLRLRAYIWADQAERLARFDAALALLRREPVRVDRASADEWLEKKLAGAPPQGVTIVYHSIVWQYFPDDVRARVRAVVESAAARATPERRLAHVQFEHDRILGVDRDGYSVTMDVWPGGERSVIASVDPHVRWIEAAAYSVHG